MIYFSFVCLCSHYFYTTHVELLLDVASRNNDSFVTSNADYMIYACKVGENKPLKAFSRHPMKTKA
uniref:Uncharacterized protein n=1 Tax=Solanum lycopersicum TaxID=4081 RepID=A0A3Q7H6W2_SOLLC